MDKLYLINEFSSPGSVGLFIGDFNGVPIGTKTYDSNQSTITYLGTGDDVSDSTSCACYVANKFKSRCDIYGFNQLGNSLVTHESLAESHAHYFAVIDQKFIVDLWLKHNCNESDFVFDLSSNEDRHEIVCRYGSHKLWSVLGHDRFYKPFEPDYPNDKKIALEGSSKTIEKTM